MNKSDTIEKIKKLLEVNRSNGATEAEEIAATERANVLMTKYQIEEHLLRGNIKTKNKKICQENDDRSLAFSQLRTAVADFFGVLALYTRTNYSFYGAPEQVELAHEMTRRAISSLSLCHTNYICTEEYRKNRRTTNRNNIRLSFGDGFYERIADRLIKLVDERAKETSRATGTNLVVLNSQNLENAFNEDFNTELKAGRAHKKRDFDHAAFAAGVVEGNKFRINQEINNFQREKTEDDNFRAN